MTLDPRRLRAWHAVASTGSIKQAAIDLGYSSSAVSQQIAALQRETGTILLEPDGRGVRPTPTGELLADPGGAAGRREDAAPVLGVAPRPLGAVETAGFQFEHFMGEPHGYDFVGNVRGILQVMRESRLGQLHGRCAVRVSDRPQGGVADGREIDVESSVRGERVGNSRPA